MRVKRNASLTPFFDGGHLLGLHQPHGTRPDGSDGPLEYKNDKFDGTPDIVKDEKGNEVYREATITLFVQNVDDYMENNAELAEAELTAVFSHEAEHDLDPNQIQLAKNNGGGRPDRWHPPSLIKKERDTFDEVRAVQIYRNAQDPYNNGCLVRQP